MNNKPNTLCVLTGEFMTPSGLTVILSVIFVIGVVVTLFNMY